MSAKPGDEHTRILQNLATILDSDNAIEKVIAAKRIALYANKIAENLSEDANREYRQHITLNPEEKVWKTAYDAELKKYTRVTYTYTEIVKDLEIALKAEKLKERELGVADKITQDSTFAFTVKLND